MENQQKIIDDQAGKSIVLLMKLLNEEKNERWPETKWLLNWILYNAPKIMKGENGKEMLSTVKNLREFLESCHRDLKYVEARLEEQNLKSRD